MVTMAVRYCGVDQFNYSRDSPPRGPAGVQQAQREHVGQGKPRVWQEGPMGLGH